VDAPSSSPPHATSSAVTVINQGRRVTNGTLSTGTGRALDDALRVP
jgi:hypothetical protein